MPVGLASQRARRCLLLAVALLLLLVPSLLLRNLTVTRAQMTQTGTCTVPAGNTTTCTLVVGGAAAVPPPSPAPESTVVAGGTMTIQLTNPPGAVITGLTGLPTGCTLVSGQGTAIVSVACQVASLGIPQGTSVTEAVNFGPSGPTPFVAETVVYNANGPGPTPQTVTGACEALAAGPGMTTVCSNTPPTAVSSGDSVTLTITGASGQNVFVDIGGALPTYGTCPLATALPTATSTTTSITYTCGPGQLAPAGAIDVTVTNASAVAATPSEVTSVVVAITPSPLPTPAPVLNAGSCGTLAAAVGATTACTGSPAGTTVAGDTLAIAVTAAQSQTVAIVGAPASLNGCPLSTPLPTSVSFPGSAVGVAYTCGPAQSIPAGTPVQVTVLNGNGASGTPQMTITANAPNPNSPTPIPEPTTVSFVFTVTPVTPTPTTISGTALTVTLLVDGQNNLAPGTGASSQNSLAPGTGQAGLNNLVPGQAIKFLASAMTTNTNATITGFTFYFADGSPPVSVPPLESDASPDASGTTLHTFSGPGPYLVAARAFDSTGASGSTVLTLNIKPTISYAGLYQPLPPAQAAAGTSMSVTLTAVPMIAGPDDTITFSFTAATEVNLGLSYGLTTGQPHTGTGPPSINGTLDFGDGSPVQLVTTTRPILHQYANPGAYNATLTATDAFGNTGQSTVQVVITMPVPQPVPASTPAAGQ